jgi:phenylacetate-CoA ligase
MNAPQFANSPEALSAPGEGGTLPEPLEREIRQIYRRSPIYGRRFPLHREPLRWACYTEMPSLSKREIVEAGHQSFFEDYAVIERGLADHSFEYENTSGTTAAPMTIIMENGWWTAQTQRAYRASPILRNSRTGPTESASWPPWGARATSAPTRTIPFRTAILTERFI